MKEETSVRAEERKQKVVTSKVTVRKPTIMVAGDQIGGKRSNCK